MICDELVVAYTWKKRKHFTKSILDLFQVPNDVAKKKKEPKKLRDTYLRTMVVFVSRRNVTHCAFS
jgi:hypothetical protein